MCNKFCVFETRKPCPVCCMCFNVPHKPTLRGILEGELEILDIFEF